MNSSVLAYLENSAHLSEPPFLNLSHREMQ